MEAKNFFYRSRRISYKMGGNGPTLLLIHGYQADSRVWDMMVPLLESRFQLIIPDLPGHGNSSLAGAVNTMDMMAECLYRLILSLGLNEIYVAGHSMGGYVALALLEKYPNLIDKLILINSHAFADSITRALARNREATLIEQGKQHQLLLLFVQNNFYELTKENNPELIRLATRMALDQPQKGMLADLAGMMARPDRFYLCEKYASRICFIYGEKDTRLPEHYILKMKECKIKVHPVENCAHLSILEKPDMVSQNMISFLE